LPQNIDPQGVGTTIFIFMTNSELVKQLTEAHEQFSALVKNIDQKTSERQPSPGEWSVGEVAHHLVLMERKIRQMVRAMRWGLMSKKLPPEMRKPAPMEKVSERKQRYKTFATFIPLHGRPLVDSLQKLNSERQKTIKFARRVNLDKLRPRYVRHPFIGALSGEEWLLFLAYHQQRHAKQIEEILERLGKKKAVAK
jgi:uncharacterized damage-inducible protein DinB